MRPLEGPGLGPVRQPRTLAIGTTPTTTLSAADQDRIRLAVTAAIECVKARELALKAQL